MLACTKHRVWQWMSLALAVGCGATEATTDAHEIDDGLAQQAPAAPAGPVTPVVSSQLLPVTVLGTGKANVYIKIFENPTITAGATIFDVHGLASTGRVFDPLTAGVWKDPAQASRVKRIITMDMPGHGGSSFPTNLPRDTNFGSLTLDDNVNVLLQVIDQLRAKNIGPSLVVGHSMGALTLTIAQQRLVDKGTSLAKLGITYVLLIAPIPSHGLPWTQPSDQELQKLTPFVKVDSAKGIYIDMPASEWIKASFVDKTGKITAKAPTVAQVDSLGYRAIEPALTVLQLSEQRLPIDNAPPPMQRPTVNAGVFGPNSGTRLAVVSFSEDGLLLPSDVNNYYRHLTGDKTDFRYVAVKSSDAVHNMTISNPEFVLAAMQVLFK